ncbi:TPA: hypothetical protein ACTXE4_000066 [Raoultella ornithinolytica]
MYHLDNTSGVPEMPEPKEQQSISPRWFGESQEQGGISWPGADWFNTVQAELLNLLAAAGIPPDKASFDQLSKAIPVLGDAGLRTDLISAMGGSKVFMGYSPISLIVRASIFQYLLPADRESLLTITGAEVVADYALKQAVADGVTDLFWPPVKGVYVAGIDPATIPLWFQSTGVNRRPYTIVNDSSFNNSGTVIRVAAGKKFPFYSTGRHVFRDINFDGRDLTSSLLYSENTGAQFNGTRFEGCGIYRFAYGLGWYYYVGTLFATRCSISGNGDGIRNLIDSSIIGCVANANKRNVALLSGANNNTFNGLRCEWAEGYNFYAYNAVENVIIGELIDRAGRAGVVAAGNASWTVNGAVVRRSGANEPVGSDYSANFLIIDSGEIIINGVKTRAGVGDTGGGTLSPSYCVSIIGSGTPVLSASGSDLSGFVTSGIHEKNSATKLIGNCAGVPDLVNAGLSKHVFGRDCSDFKSGFLAAGAASTLTLSLKHDQFTQFQTPLYRRILIESRRELSGATDFSFIPCAINFETSVAKITPLPNTIPAGNISSDPAATGAVASLSINSDGTLITLTLTSVDGLKRNINATLLPV